LASIRRLYLYDVWPGFGRTSARVWPLAQRRRKGSPTSSSG